MPSKTRSQKQKGVQRRHQQLHVEYTHQDRALGESKRKTIRRKKRKNKRTKRGGVGTMNRREAQITKTLPPYMQIWFVAWLNGMKDGTNIMPAQFETFRKKVAEMARGRKPLLDEREEFGT